MIAKVSRVVVRVGTVIEHALIMSVDDLEVSVIDESVPGVVVHQNRYVVITVVGERGIKSYR